MQLDGGGPQPTGQPAIAYSGRVLHIEELPVTDLARRFGTPLYAYSSRVLREQYTVLEAALRGLTRDFLICYALKANANPTIGRMLAGWGAGADVVSGGEIYLARRMNFAGDRIVFAGVGKTRHEIAEALEAGVRSFHVESAGEMRAIAEVASSKGLIAPVAVRVNPDVEAGTHPYITTGTRYDKFGVSPAEALELVRYASKDPWLRAAGLHAHVGSQLPSVQPVIQAATVLLELWDQLAAEGIKLTELDIGGGLGIPYRPGEQPEGPEALAAGLRPLLRGHDLDLLVEPGRFLVGPAGVLLTTVLYTKQVPGRTSQTVAAGTGTAGMVVVDAGMNDLLRPALYGAWHPVWPAEEAENSADSEAVDVVGPVCESSDILARDRMLGQGARPGQVLAIGQAGAYGYSMASQYNGRIRPAEVLVQGSEAILIRPRETYQDLLAGAE